MKLLHAHVDETQSRFRLLGPRRDIPAVPAEPGAQAEVPGRRDGLQACAPNTGDDRRADRKEPPR